MTIQRIISITTILFSCLLARPFVTDEKINLPEIVANFSSSISLSVKFVNESKRKSTSLNIEPKIGFGCNENCAKKEDLRDLLDDGGDETKSNVFGEIDFYKKYKFFKARLI